MRSMPPTRAHGRPMIPILRHFKLILDRFEAKPHKSSVVTIVGTAYALRYLGATENLVGPEENMFSVSN